MIEAAAKTVERAGRVCLIEELRPAASNRRIAKTVGLSKDTVRGEGSPRKSQKKTKKTKQNQSTGGDKSPRPSGTAVVELAQKALAPVWSPWVAGRA
jgi:ribosomal protein L13E